MTKATTLSPQPGELYVPNVDVVARYLFMLVALADLWFLPEITSLALTVGLTRRSGRLWKAVAVTFGGLTCWVLVVSRLIGFSVSGYLVVLLGVALDPNRLLKNA